MNETVMTSDNSSIPEYEGRNLRQNQEWQ